MKAMVVDSESGLDLSRVADKASLPDLIRFCAEVQGHCGNTPYEPFSSDWAGRFISRLLKESVVHQTITKVNYFKPFLEVVAKAMAKVSTEELTFLAKNEHPVVMSYIMSTTDISSKEFVRSDEKGREHQLGIELGL